MIYVVASTCGQGTYPSNSINFMKEINELDADCMKNVNFAIFGLGDSGYAYYNKTAYDVQTAFLKYGGNEIFEIGLGDDHDEDKFMTV